MGYLYIKDSVGYMEFQFVTRLLYVSSLPSNIPRNHNKLGTKCPAICPEAMRCLTNRARMLTRTCNQLSPIHILSCCSARPILTLQGTRRLWYMRGKMYGLVVRAPAYETRKPSSNPGLCSAFCDLVKAPETFPPKNVELFRRCPQVRAI